MIPRQYCSVCLPATYRIYNANSPRWWNPLREGGLNNPLIYHQFVFPRVNISLMWCACTSKIRILIGCTSICAPVMGSTRNKRERGHQQHHHCNSLRGHFMDLYILIESLCGVHIILLTCTTDVAFISLYCLWLNGTFKFWVGNCYRIGNG